MRILVVEDQPQLLENTLALVTDAGHELVMPDLAGGHWRDVLESARGCQIVLLDLSIDANQLFDGDELEGRVGTELLKRLRKEREFRLPVVVLTHLSLAPPEVAKLRSLGVQRILSKTALPALEGLATTLEQVVKERS